MSTRMTRAQHTVPATAAPRFGDSHSLTAVSDREERAAPAVSVIIPARDAAPTLARTLELLRRQDLPSPFEVLVVDDGSRDRTREIAGRYEPWVSVISLESSHGPG